MNSFEIKCKPWTQNKSPKRALAIRYQALGDVVITFPYLNSLKEKNPLLEIDFVTLVENSDIPNSLRVFERVYSIAGGRNFKLQFMFTLLLIPRLWLRRYELVLDLQNHRMSNMIRKFLRPSAWCEFDRFSANPAGERNRVTINALGLAQVELSTRIHQQIDEQSIETKLMTKGWKPNRRLVIINPAGAFETRHWPLQNYIELAKKWLTLESTIQFLAVGLKSKIGLSATSIKQQLGGDFINLTGETSTSEAFALVRKAALVITEDGGLMHMAWVQGIPTLALFGSTRSDWSAPLGDRSLCLNSSDLPCGNCLLEVCKFGNVHCLTRYSPDYILQQALRLVQPG